MLEGLVDLVRGIVLGLAYLIPGFVTPLAGANVEAHLTSGKQPGQKASISY